MSGATQPTQGGGAVRPLTEALVRSTRLERGGGGEGGCSGGARIGICVAGPSVWGRWGWKSIAHTGGPGLLRWSLIGTGIQPPSRNRHRGYPIPSHPIPFPLQHAKVFPPPLPLDNQAVEFYRTGSGKRLPAGPQENLDAPITDPRPNPNPNPNIFCFSKSLRP